MTFTPFHEVLRERLPGAFFRPAMHSKGYLFVDRIDHYPTSSTTHHMTCCCWTPCPDFALISYSLCLIIVSSREAMSESAVDLNSYYPWEPCPASKSTIASRSRPDRCSLGEGGLKSVRHLQNWGWIYLFYYLTLLKSNFKYANIIIKRS